MTAYDPLFTPLKLGAIELEHRVVMAPLTRLRSAQPGNIPQTMNAIYYGQRASKGGLQIAEATNVSEQAEGYPGAPGIHSADQVAGWKAVTDAVHAKGGYIFLQIWHTGRVSHSSMQPGGGLPVAPSAIAIKGMGHMDAHGNPLDFETPRALALSEIPDIVESFAQATRNAREAGFDGVEIHSANGYLLDQFLQDSSNLRTDEYGGSIPNRGRLLLETVDGVVAAWEPGRVGVRLSPWGSFNGMHDSNPGALYDYVSAELGKRHLAYLHVVEPRADQQSDINAIDPDAPDAADRVRKGFGGVVISAGGYTGESARAAISDGTAQAIAFGRMFISNPDLAERLRVNAPLNRYDRSTFYGGGEKGYTDYPALENIDA